MQPERPYDRRMLEPMRSPSSPTGRASGLSPREMEVLDLAALGLTNPQIAARLQVTVHAVKFHLAGIYRKLGVANRTEAVVRWLGVAPGPRGLAERDADAE
jgi:DNA-binding CsgD family transcriptional regulator